MPFPFVAGAEKEKGALCDANAEEEDDEAVLVEGVEEKVEKEGVPVLVKVGAVVEPLVCVVLKLEKLNGDDEMVYKDNETLYNQRCTLHIF